MTQLADVCFSVPPTILAGERILNVIENRSLTIECLADGTPEPVLRWYKDGRLLAMDASDGNGRNGNGHHHRHRHHPRRHGHSYQITGNRLVIPQAQLSDAGRYTCEAESAGAGSASVDFAVDVYGKSWPFCFIISASSGSFSPAILCRSYRLSQRCRRRTSDSGLQSRS